MSDAVVRELYRRLKEREPRVEQAAAARAETRPAQGRPQEPAKPLEAIAVIDKLARLGLFGAPSITCEQALLLQRMVERTRGVQGDIVEVGVNRGTSLMVLAAAAPDREVIGIDTFAWFPRTEEGYAKGSIAASKEVVEKNLRAVFECIPKNVELVEVDITTNVPRLGPIRLLHFDADTGNALKGTLRAFWNSLSVGGVLVMHDMDGMGFDSLRKAFLDWFRKRRRPELMFNGRGRRWAGAVTNTGYVWLKKVAT